MPKIQAFRKVTIGNLRTGETLEAQFNPADFEESISANWQRVTVPGMSHQPLQYSHTGNHAFPMEFYAHGFTETDRRRVVEFRNFLSSLLYPSASATSIRTGAPPRVLVVWPGLLTITAVVMGVKFSNKSFATDLGLTRLSASVDFEEIRDTRLTSEEVRERGTLRGSAGSGSAGSGAT